MTKRYKSEALAAAHEAALGLAEAGVMPKRTTRVFDEMCLAPEPYDVRSPKCKRQEDLTHRSFASRRSNSFKPTER